MEEKVIGILKDVSELIVATLIEETDTLIRVKNPAFLGINGKNGQININFIPVEMLSIDPPVNIRNLIANPTADIIFTFAKDRVLKYDFELAQNVIENYRHLTSPKQAPQKPEDNIVKLF